MSPIPTDQAMQTALQHQHAGRFAQAEQIYRQLVAQQPNHADALHQLGVMAGQQGRLDAAIELISQAIAIRTTNPFYHHNLGFAFHGGGQLDEAIAAYRRAIQLKPDYAAAHTNLGNALNAKGQVDEAIETWDRAIKFDPKSSAAHYNMGVALQGRGRLDEAIVCYRHAIRIRPDYCEAQYNLGNALQVVKQFDEAIVAYREAIRIRPGYAEAYNNLGFSLKETGQIDGAIASFRDAIRLKPGYAKAHSNLVFILQYHPAYDGGMIREELGRWNERHAARVAKLRGVLSNDRDPDRRLRVGYVSPDFCDHVVGQNLLPLLREHDHREVEVFCYSAVDREDAITERLRGYADVWHRIHRSSDEEVAGLAREDKIDILVDLALHSAKNRLVVFARKPAPVQVTFAGYPGSTGVGAIDYRLTDPYLDPRGLNDLNYCETSVRLPHSFWCYDPPDIGPEANPLPALTNGYITFGCLNNFPKVNESVLRLWARVLREVAQSRLLLLCPVGGHRRALFELLLDEGIAPDRIELIHRCPRPQYFAQYHRIDVGLDTFPYNGHTTSLDSYWMGVPVVTLVGKTVVGRAGLSQLTNLGITELIAQTPKEFVQIAVGLAGDLRGLVELRRTLRSRMQASPLMDAPRFARDIEAALRKMWQRWCRANASVGP